MTKVTQEYSIIYWDGIRIGRWNADQDPRMDPHPTPYSTPLLLLVRKQIDKKHVNMFGSDFPVEQLT